jgi:putative ABC transport system substrate-binding protein
MLSSRRFAAVALSTVLVLCVAVVPANGQSGKVARVGILDLSSRPGSPSNPATPRVIGAFTEALRELGWTEGQNLAFERRWADYRPERLPELAADLVRASPDVIVVPGPAPLWSVVRATTTIPVVMVASTADPVGAGLTQSLARPSRNVTGLTWAPEPAVLSKSLELLKEALPRSSHVTVIWDGAAENLAGVAPRLREDAARLRLAIPDPLVVSDPAGLERAIAMAAQDRTSAVIVAMAGVSWARRARVAELAIQHRLPTAGAFRELPEAGGLLSYGPNIVTLYRRAAVYVDKILKGARPSDLPIEEPSRFELVINLKTAQALGLTIPASVLGRANEVIQ